MRIKKEQLLNLFKDYKSAANFFGINNSAISIWDYIPIRRLHELELAQMIDRKIVEELQKSGMSNNDIKQLFNRVLTDIDDIVMYRVTK